MHITRTSSRTSRCAYTVSRRRGEEPVPDAAQRAGRRPRVALAILAGIETGISCARSPRDVARLRQVKGVGGKIAERLALELREKILPVGGAWAQGLAREAARPRRGPGPSQRRPVRSARRGSTARLVLPSGTSRPEIEPLLEKMNEKAVRSDENCAAPRWSALRRG
jgi:hypothetical protein